MYNKCFHIKEINEKYNIIFLIKSLEEIRKLYNMKRISISKYLNTIYNFYCNKTSINYKPIFENKKIIDLNDDIIKNIRKKII